MHRALGLAFLLPALFLPATAADEDAGDRILKRFAGEFVELTPGKGKFPASFVMGSTGEGLPASEKPAVTVTFKRNFSIARYEVTQELYLLVMGNNPSKWAGKRTPAGWTGRRNSVEMISWQEANTFCSKVTGLLRARKLIGDKETIRLPSEAEWEYACRAGTKTRYSFGDSAADLGEYAWFTGNAAGNDPPVGRKKPNPWGLYDVHGYVWEWCLDAWHPDYKDAPKDGSARAGKDAKERVIRGGSWADKADAARSAYRGHRPASERKDSIGFRCVKVAAP